MVDAVWQQETTYYVALLVTPARTAKTDYDTQETGKIHTLEVQVAGDVAIAIAAAAAATAAFAATGGWAVAASWTLATTATAAGVKAIADGVALSAEFDNKKAGDAKRDADVGAAIAKAAHDRLNDFDAWHASHPHATQADPLLIDLAGLGITTTDLAGAKAHFAWTPGEAATATGWMGAGTGMLVTLDSHGAPVPIGAADPTLNGFADLAALDANHDGVLDASDPTFSQLRVWVDANGDGIADAGELKTLAALHITSIGVASTAADTVDHGNLIAATGSVTLADGTTRQLADVTFASAPQPVTVDFTADTAAHQFVAGDGDTLILMGSGGGSIHLGAGTDTVIGGSGRDAVTFGPGLGLVTGGQGGLNSFIFVKGQVATGADGHLDTVTDFHGAGQAWTPDHDFIWLKGFDAGASMTLEHDLAPGRHLYAIADAGGTAEIELDYAGAGVQLNHAQWAVMA